MAAMCRSGHKPEFKTLYETLNAPQLAVYDTLETLFAKRDEVWEKVNAETTKFSKAELLDRLLAADIWCAGVNDIRRRPTIRR